jgi:hypothetical protein
VLHTPTTARTNPSADSPTHLPGTHIEADPMSSQRAMSPPGLVPTLAPACTAPGTNLVPSACAMRVLLSRLPPTTSASTGSSMEVVAPSAPSLVRLLSPATLDPGVDSVQPLPPIDLEANRTGSSVSAPATSTRPATRLQHGISKPVLYTDGIVRYGLFTATGEPQTLHEALGDSRWKAAMDSEIEALHRNET